MSSHPQEPPVSKDNEKKREEEKPSWLGPTIKLGPIEGPLLVIVLVSIGIFAGAVGTYLLYLRPNVIDPLIEIGVKETMAAQTPAVIVEPMPTYTLCPTCTPYPTNTPVPPPTPTNTPTPSPPVIIDTMDSTSGWSTFGDPESSIEIRTVPGVNDNAIEISYTLQPGGWGVGISRSINPEVLAGTSGIRFYRSGSGASNTIELKLLYAPDPSGQSTTFEYLWPTDTGGDWSPREVIYSEYCEFACLVLGEVRTINFAISSREGGTPGSGTVVIDHVVGIR